VQASRKTQAAVAPIAWKGIREFPSPSPKKINLKKNKIDNIVCNYGVVF